MSLLGNFASLYMLILIMLLFLSSILAIKLLFQYIFNALNTSFNTKYSQYENIFSWIKLSIISLFGILILSIILFFIQKFNI